ncbi:hypothetical protein [Okeania sp. SIO2B3]|uniref:hypothetical protein n=1 Tax=Okeania sp. SIO2B3 TaxID=2607784 RepID=UPI0013C1A1B1|nr:hypothetical protein [Okeania sp. SIO2B3]NET43582.1 hypothetical protein [Okeania sp. SIO2B3]
MVDGSENSDRLNSPDYFFSTEKIYTYYLAPSSDIFPTILILPYLKIIFLFIGLMFYFTRDINMVDESENSDRPNSPDYFFSTEKICTQHLAPSSDIFPTLLILSFLKIIFFFIGLMF